MRNALIVTDSLIGSDALVPLDGRWSRATIDEVVRRHIASLKVVQRHRTFLGYTLHGESLWHEVAKVTFTTPITFDKD